jgi:hypothetical protein
MPLGRPTDPAQASRTGGAGRPAGVVAVIFAVWEFFYFGYSWAVSGGTFGMAVLGEQVVRADRQVLDSWRGALRALVFPLSFLLLGAGFLGILVQREHRALHDLIAGTADLCLGCAGGPAPVPHPSGRHRSNEQLAVAPQPRSPIPDPSPGLAGQQVPAGAPLPSAAGDASRASSGDH